MKNKIILMAFLLAGLIESASAWNTIQVAAGQGNLSEIQRLLNAGIEVDSRDTEYHKTPLILAAQGGQTAAARLLLDNGADVNAYDKCCTALHFAASEGFKDVAKLLLDRGANINSRDHCGGTPLMEAVCNNRAEIVKLLLDSNADINIKGTDLGWKNNTALMIANQKGYSDIARLIEAAPRERAQREKALESARVQAVKKQTEEMIAQLNNAPLDRLLGKQELDNGEYVEALTDAIITAKNKQLPDFLATATSEQKVDMLTSVEKQIARATARIDEVNAEAGTAVSKGQDPVPFRKRAGQIKAYINVLNEIKAILEQS